MEPKKNPKYDVHRQRGTIFQISLAITLTLVIMAFKWKTPVAREVLPDHATLLAYSPIEDIIASPSFKSEEPPKPKEIKPPSPTEFKPVEDLLTEDDDQPNPTVDQGEPVSYSNPSFEIELLKEVDTVIFCIVEKMPEPVGGYEGFYKTLSKNIKYPRRASNDQITGKVFVSFVVNEKSELSDFKVVKGIGSGCDEEAIRVIGLTKWQAGKQRGKPVKVRMMQTINFRIK